LRGDGSFRRALSAVVSPLLRSFSLTFLTQALHPSFNALRIAILWNILPLHELDRLILSPHPLFFFNIQRQSRLSAYPSHPSPVVGNFPPHWPPVSPSGKTFFSTRYDLLFCRCCCFSLTGPVTVPPPFATAANLFCLYKRP